MCFTIPVKVLKIENKIALIEGCHNVRLGKDLEVKMGDYLQVQGKMAVSVLTKSEGLKIRQLIKSLNNQ